MAKLATYASFSHHVSWQTLLINYHTHLIESIHNLWLFLKVLQASTPNCSELVIKINLFASSAWGYSQCIQSTGEGSHSAKEYRNQGCTSIWRLSCAICPSGTHGAGDNQNRQLVLDPQTWDIVISLFIRDTAIPKTLNVYFYTRRLQNFGSKRECAYVLQHTQARGSKGLTESHVEPRFHHSTADKYSMAKTDSAKTVLYS